MNFVEATKEKINLLCAGIGLLLLVLAAVSWAGYQTVLDFRVSNELVARTYLVLDSLETTLTAVGDAEAGTRDFVLTKKLEYLGPFEQGSEAVQEELRHLRELTKDDAWQQDKVARLEGLTKKLTDLSKKAVEERYKSLAAALRFVRKDDLKLLRHEFRQVIGEMRGYESKLLADRQREAARRMQKNTIWCGVLLLADIGFFVWVGLISYRLNHLHRVIRVCAWTKKVQHEGHWITLEEYFQKALDAPVSHGICAEAAETMMDNVMKRTG